MWPETGDVETQLLAEALPLEKLEEVTTVAAENNMSPSEFLADCFVCAGFDVLMLDWKGPA